MPDPVDIQLGGPLLAAEIVASPAGARSGAAGGERPPGGRPCTPNPQALLDEERKNLVQVGKALELAVQRLSALEEQTIADAETQLVELALAVAQKVLMQEIENGRYRVETIVREALRHLPTRRVMVVRLNPEDLAAWEQAAAGAAATEKLPVVADSRLRRAECLVETAEGGVSATLADRLREAARMLTSTE
ncbi:MAG: FliH/SctL family protein [Planctomycetota bacterium]|nr:FliH/SctL family protein [Planctomycetota bacterium]